jgi:hypothetical protein
MHTQGSTRIDQDMPTSPARRSWKKHSNNTPNRTTPHSTDKGPYHGSNIHATLSKYMQTLEDNVSMHMATIEDIKYHRLISLYNKLEI